jgi:hypothetical protein
MKTIFVLCSAFCLVGFSAFAQKEVDPFAEQNQSVENHIPRLIRVQLEFVEMAHKDLTRLLMEDKVESSDATALRMKVQAMVDKDEAKVIETQIAVGRSGQKQTAESIHEVIYPTEYEPPSFDEKKLKKLLNSGFPANPATPTAFETKNVGSTLETEPTLGENDRIIDLRFLPELIWHTGNTLWNEQKDELGNVFKVTMPDFYKMSINTSITCIAGQYVMVGALSPRDAQGEVDPDRKVMVFVKCTVMKAR